MYGWETPLQEVRREGEDLALRHGSEALADFLGAYGWRVVEHLGYGELAERYTKPTGRELATTPIERMV